MRDLIKRNTPAIALMFKTELSQNDENTSFYEICADKGKILLTGDSTISLAMAYYRYLKEYCNVNLSWCGNFKMTVDEAPLPDKTIRETFEFDKRAYFNHRAFSYDAWLWDWERWEREIDFMAINGVTLPLSLDGSEAVWYYTLRDFKYTEDEALQFISGPAFWSWQLTDNLDSYLALTDVDYIEKRLELGKKIIQRQLELGMTPVLSGFYGHAPRISLSMLKKVRVRRNPSWRNFSLTYQIEPTDPYFQKFGKAFLEKQLRLLGAGHYYTCDPLYDNFTFPRGETYYKSLAKSISKLFESFDREAVLIMQGDTVNKEFVNSFSKDTLLILDLDGQGHKKHDNYWGYDFVLGCRNNKGGHSSLHGDISALAACPYSEVKSTSENLVGSGFFPESFGQNPLYFDLALEMLAKHEAIDLDEWLKKYALRRYGSRENCLFEALFALKETCYSHLNDEPETGSIICARPSTDLPHASIGDSSDLRYDNRKLLEALEILLEAKKTVKEGYSFDVRDLTRQVLSNYARDLYFEAMEAYQGKQAQRFELAINAFLRLTEDMDALMQTDPNQCLFSLLKKAREAGLTDKDKQNFEINVLTQLTVFGPINDPIMYDEAWREWGCLLGTYYMLRWREFYYMLAQNFKGYKRVSTKTKKQFFGRNDYRGNGFYKNLERFEKDWISTCRPPAPSDEDPIKLSKDLLKKYRFKIMGE